MIMLSSNWSHHFDLWLKSQSLRKSTKSTKSQNSNKEEESGNEILQQKIKTADADELKDNLNTSDSENIKIYICFMNKK